MRIKLNKIKYKGKWVQLQNKKWERHKSVLLKSGYYHDLIQKETRFENYPIINKALFMTHFDEINTVGVKLEEAFQIATEAEQTRDFSPVINGVTVGLSSGTSGSRGVFLATEKERAQWVAAVLDRVIGFSLIKRKVAFFLRANSNLYDSVKSKVLQFEFFDLLDQLDEHIARLNKLQPTFLVAQPSMLLELANGIKEGRLSISPQKVISVAEVLYPEDKAYLEGVFGQTIHQVYQCTEGFLASTCEYGVLHFHEDFFKIEKKYIDESKSRFHPIITDLERTSQPVIRYELNDIIQEKKGCKCGSDWIAIEAVEGRSDDVFEFIVENDVVKIFPDFFRRAIIMSSDEIREYALVKRGKSELLLFIEGEELAYDKAKTAVQELLLRFGIKEVDISRISSHMTEKGNKLRRIRNE